MNPVAAQAKLYRGCAGQAYWSSGSKATGVGNMADVYVYPRPTYDLRVNSLYVQSPTDSGATGVEIGWTSSPTHNPWPFTVWYDGGMATPVDWPSVSLPVNSRISFEIANTSNGDDWQMYMGGILYKNWPNTGMNSGWPVNAEERNSGSDDGRASMTNCQLLKKTGGVYDWTWWSDGGRALDAYDTPYYFRFNHVTDANHWVYCDDHNN